MPHFVIDCSENVLTQKSGEKILTAVHDTAEATGLFKPGDIKARIRPFSIFTVGNSKSDFIHVLGNIMEGRTTKQKAELSKAIIIKLKSMFADVPVISINIQEFDKLTYSNRNII